MKHWVNSFPSSFHFLVLFGAAWGRFLIRAADNPSLRQGLRLHSPRSGVMPGTLILLFGWAAMDAPAALTVDGTTNVITVSTSITGDVVVGTNLPYSALVITNGADVTNSGTATLGFNGSSDTNRVIVTGNGTSWINSGDLFVGYLGAFNSLLITNGGIVNHGSATLGAQTSASNNTVTVTGLGSVLSSSNSLRVGESGSNNQLTVAGGGSVLAGGLDLGFNTTSLNNSLTISGGNAFVTNTVGTSVVDVRRGNILISSDGLLRTDRLLLTNGGFSGFNLQRGTLQARSVTCSNGAVFNIGIDSFSSPAALELLGNGTNFFANGLNIPRGGTLTASGTIVGNVSNDRGTLTLGSSIVRVTINGSLTLSGSGTTVCNLELDKASNTNDSIAGLTSVAYGGTLNVVNLGGTLAAGDSFKLFTAGSYSGSFSSVALPALASGLAWTNKLPIDGSIEVIPGPSTNRYWTNVSGGTYGVAANWSPANVPHPQDDANFTNNASYQVDWAADAKVAQALFNAPGGAVTQAVGGFTWTVTNRYIVGESPGTAGGVRLISGTLAVTNPSGNALLEMRRGTNTFNGGMILADRLLLTNSTGRLQFDSGALITRGATISNGVGFSIGASLGSSGASWIVLSNSTPTVVDGYIYTGEYGAFNSLFITNGGTVNSTEGRVGVQASSDGNSVMVGGIGSAWTNSGSLNVGVGGSFNTLLITNGGKVNNTSCSVGFQPYSMSNTVIVSGIGSTLINNGSLGVGGFGSANTMLITDGGTVSGGSLTVGDTSVSVGNTVTISGLGSTLTNSGNLTVGGGSTGGSLNTLLITNGGAAYSSHGYIGDSGGNSNAVTVSGADSTWIIRLDLYVGPGSFNTLLITSGGALRANFAEIGRSGVGNAVTVSGPGSTWANSGPLAVGSLASSFSTLLITNGGAVSAPGVTVGRDSTSLSNRLTVADGTLRCTNSIHSVALDIRRGTSVLDAGLIEASRLLLTNALGFFAFNGGTLNSRFATVSNGVPFVVGNGSTAANYFLNGAATNVHAFADGLVLTNNATLTGNGTVGGLLTVAAGGTVAPGSSVGRLNLTQPPVLGGTVFMGISKNGGTLTNDILAVTGTLTYGGSLIVTNLGPDALVAGNTFQLFSASGYAGSFTSVTLPSLGGGLIWNTNLLVSGTIQVTNMEAAAPPVITNQPVSLSVLLNSNATFTVSAGGTAPLAYQWRFNGTNLAGADADSYTRTNAQLADAGDYTVVITNLAGSVTSAVAALTVIPPGDRFWTNSAGGTYQTGVNWTPNFMPTAADNAVFTNNASYQVTWATNATVASALLNAPGGVVTQAVAGFNWTVTNRYVVGENGDNAAAFWHLNGRLAVTNSAGDALLELRRGTNTFTAGVIEADRLLLTNSTGRLTFNGGTLITRGASISNGANFNVGSSITGTNPATWIVLSNATATALSGTLVIGEFGDNTSLLITNGGTVLNTTGWIGFQSASTGNTVTVSGAGSTWTNSSSLTVGVLSSFNTLVITNGGTVQNNSGSIGSGSLASNNAVLVAGAGSTWANSGNVTVGDLSSFNTLVITNGGTVQNDSGYIGSGSLASNNTVTVSGPQSAWMNGSSLNVGDNGDFNTLLIANGGKVNNTFGHIGANTPSAGNAVTVSGSSSTWTNSLSLNVGYFGAFNTLLIANGGTVSSGIGNVGASSFSSNNTVTVSGTGSTWSASGILSVGVSGDFNTLLLTNGGAVVASNVVVGFNSSSADNLLTVAGGSLINTNASGTCDLDVRRGAAVFNGGTVTADRLLLTNGSASQFTFNSGTLNLRQTTVSNGTPLTVGDGVGAATYFLSGVATNVHAFASGLVLASNATLSGSGTVTGAVSVTVGGTLAPGSAAAPGSQVQIGTISLASPPSLAGTTAMQIRKGSGVLTNDILAVTGTLNYGGNLIVSKIGPDDLMAGDTVQLFSAGGYAGTFASVTLPSLGAGLAWNNQLALNGTLAVISTAAPVISGVTRSGTDVIFTVTNGVPGGTWQWLTATNVTLPLVSWTTNSSGVFDLSGNVTLTNSLNVTEPKRFYRLSMP